MGSTLIKGGRVSIHAPHTGRDVLGIKIVSVLKWFQSTRPTRGATVPPVVHHQSLEFQSTRPTRGATPQAPANTTQEAVSIHAPHTGRDPNVQFYDYTKHKFQSTRPTRGATTQAVQMLAKLVFQSTRPTRGATGRLLADADDR